MKFLCLLLTVSTCLTFTGATIGLNKRAIHRVHFLKYSVSVRDRTTQKVFTEDMIPTVKSGLSLFHSFPSMLEYSASQWALTKKTISFAKKMNDPRRAEHEIKNFLKHLKINMSEFEPSDPFSYRTFNEFFYRPIKPNARPIASPDTKSVLVSAADCRLNVFNSINNATNIWIKGKNFSASALLNNQTLANRFNNGSIALFRLAPQDYHRFHSPVDGTVISTVDIPGLYYSVNPLVVCTELDVFTENRRAVSLIQSEKFGLVAFVTIGATLVGSINFTGLKKGAVIKRGDELGYFAYGGSTVAVLFESNRVRFDDDLIRSSSKAVETLVKMGEKIGGVTL